MSHQDQDDESMNQDDERPVVKRSQNDGIVAKLKKLVGR